MELKQLKTSRFFLSRLFLPRSVCVVAAQGLVLALGGWWEHVGGPGFTRVTPEAEGVGERLLGVSRVALAAPEDGSQERLELGSWFSTIFFVLFFPLLASVTAVCASRFCSCSWKQCVVSCWFVTIHTCWWADTSSFPHRHIHSCIQTDLLCYILNLVAC